MCDQEHQRAKGKKRKNKREDRIIQDKIEEEEKKETFPIKASAKQTASLWWYHQDKKQHWNNFAFIF